MERLNEELIEVTELLDEELDAVAGGWIIPSSLLLKVVWNHDYGSGTCNTDGTYTP